jgi:hypothetical protein
VSQVLFEHLFGSLTETLHARLTTAASQQAGFPPVSCSGGHLSEVRRSVASDIRFGRTSGRTDHP